MSSNQPPSFELWQNASFDTLESLLSLELDELEHAVNVAIGKKHALIFSKENERVCLTFPVDAVSDLYRWLLSLSDREQWEAWGFTIGDSLICWSKAAKLSLDLLASRHYIPYL